MTVSTDPVLDPGLVLGAVVFRAGDRAITRGEIVRWAERFDQDHVARRQRRAALAALDTDDDERLEAAGDATATAFRYARKLESAEAMRQWLAANGLSVDAWWESLRRTVLEERAREGVIPSVPPAHAEPDDAWLADLVAADVLAPAAQALARRMAVACALGAAPGGTGATDHDALEATWRAWRGALVTEPALRQVIERERLSWLVLDVVETAWSAEGAAREAVSCVRHDGMALDDVARDAGAPVKVYSCLLEGAPAVLRDALLAAAPGELVGPIAGVSRWIVALVRGKRAPALDDALVRATAERAIESRAAAPLLAQHVHWVETAR